jgi:O-Antigen ligase
MNLFFLILELFIYGFAIFLFIKKKELCIIYLPVLFFADTIITTHILPSIIFYGVVSILLIRSINENIFFYRFNIFSILIIIYFLVLTTRSSDLGVLKENLFNVIFFFISLPLIAAIYKKYNRDIIFRELSKSALILLVIFISNVFLSTIFNYNVHFMYGISSGILFGNLYATDFNILAIALFLILFNSLQKKNLIYLIVFLISLSFIAVSMRRSVIAIALIGVAFCMIILFSQNARKLLAFSIVAILMGGFIVVKSDLLTAFNERYELRKLGERELQEEKRFIEYDLLYKDMFQNKRYSPWIGFEVLNSPHNYGGGIFYERSLHGDLPSITHSSGIIGLLLYILMIITTFFRSFKAAETKEDYLTILFCVLAFATYTATGRFTEYGSMLLLFLTAQLPLAKKETEPHVEIKFAKEGNGVRKEDLIELGIDR